jgi:RNA polymerase sigma factor (sigma-70 family)
VDFDELFEDVYPRLYRYCLRMAPDADLAEDTAQEAFVRLLDRKVDGDAAGLRAWLFKVATHLLRDRARVHENRRRLLEENPVVPDGPPGPEEEMERELAVARVRRVLGELDDRERTLLLLREEGFSYRELAEAVGVQPSSVGTLLVRARRRFEERMNGEMDP